MLEVTSVAEAAEEFKEVPASQEPLSVADAARFSERSDQNGWFCEASLRSSYTRSSCKGLGWLCRDAGLAPAVMFSAHHLSFT